GIAMGPMGRAQCTIDAGPDRTLELSSLLFMDAVSPTEGIISWWAQSDDNPSTVNFLNLYDPQSEVTGLVPGTYVFMWRSVTIGCGFDSFILTDTVEITMQGVDLELEALADDTGPAIGDVVGFTDHLSNLGNVPATEIGRAHV